MKASKRITRRIKGTGNDLLTWSEQKELLRVFLDGRASPKYNVVLRGAKFFFFISLLQVLEEFCKNTKAIHEGLAGPSNR